MNTLMKQLEVKFSHVPDELAKQLRAAEVSVLDTCLERILTAHTLEDVLQP